MWRQAAAMTAVGGGGSPQGNLLYCNKNTVVESVRQKMAYKAMEISLPFELASAMSSSVHIPYFFPQLHSVFLKSGYLSHTSVSNSLVSVFFRAGDAVSAQKVFDGMPSRDYISYNSMVSGMTGCGNRDSALHWFGSMRTDGFIPDGITLASLLSRPAGDGCIGKQVHSYSIKAGISSEAIVEGSLLHMYVSLPDPKAARNVFLSAHTAANNVLLWNVMILSHADLGDLRSCFSLFSLMLRGDPRLNPNHYTYATILRACVRSAVFLPVLQIHSHLLKSGFHLNLHICSVLISFYAKVGRPEKAFDIFQNLLEDDVTCWTCMIAGFTENGLHPAALRLFMGLTGFCRDALCFASALNSAGHLQLLNPGQQIQAVCYVSGNSTHVSVCNSIVGFYARCGHTRNALTAFSSAVHRDDILWNSLISGFAQSGFAEESLSVFSDMNRSGTRATAFTFGSALSAASVVGCLEQGQQVHAAAVKQGAESETEVANALITLYSRCGDVSTAEAQFRQIPRRSTASWNAMISAYSQHGLARPALTLLETMRRESVTPNSTTFLAVLSACSHSGLVDPALLIFGSIPKPHMDHYAAVVDLLGRAGQLDRAHKFIESMPVKPDAAIWTAFLASCRVHGNIQLAEVAALRLSGLQPDDSAPYVLLGNVYNAAGRWRMKDEVAEIMRGRGVQKKQPGFSRV